MHARVTMTTGAAVDEKAMSYLREQLLPQARALEGFKGILDLADPATGEGLTITLWESEAAMKASEEAAGKLRDSASGETGETVVDVKRFEVATLEIE